MGQVLDEAASPSEAPSGAWRRPLGVAGIFAAYVVLAVVATYPLALRAGDHVFGLATPELNIWSMGFVLHQLPREPLRLFDGNAFYPYPRTLSLSEHLFVPALLAAPVALLTGNLVLAHNVVALLTLAMAGLGMFLLARELTGDGPSSFAAGVLYAFHTWNVNELIRLQILSNQYFPLLLLGLLRFFARPGKGRAAAVGAAYALQSLSCMYWALYAPLLTAPLLLVLQWRHRHAWRSLRPLAVSLGVALLATGLFAVPYFETARELGFQRRLPDPVEMDRYLDVLSGNLLYADLLGTARPNQNAAHFLGFAAMALGLLGALRGRFRDDLKVGRGVFIGLALAGFLLSLGPEIRVGGHALAPGPYRLLIESVPGFRNVRYPERFSLFTVLGLAVLAAAGLAQLRPRLGRRVPALAGILIFLEHLSAPLALSPLPTGERIPAVYRWLAGQEDVRVVAEVPAARHRMERLDALPMYLSTVHWKRTVQGFTGYFPPTHNFIRWRLFHFPAPESVAFLERFGVDTVVVSRQGTGPPPWALPDPRWRIEGPFPEGHLVLRLSGARGQAYGPPPRAEGLVEVERSGWEVQASYPGARLAVDGDEDTAWSTGEERQGRGDFFRINFPRLVNVARVSLAVGDPYEFPMHLKLLGESEQGPVEVPFDEASAYDRLFALLLHRPRAASLGIDLDTRPLRGLRLRIAETDPFFMPWTMSEVRVYEREGGG